MAFEKGMVDLFLANTALRALIDKNLFPKIAKQTATGSYVTYTIINQEPGRILTGHSGHEKAFIQFEVSCKALPEEQPHEKERAIREALYNVIGKNGIRTTWDGTVVDVARWAGQADITTNPFAGDDIGILGENLVLIVVWTRT